MLYQVKPILYLMKNIGYIDNNGLLYVLSRADDMIIKGGMNIYPIFDIYRKIKYIVIFYIII